MENFSPLSALAGGCLIGLAAGMLWLVNGRTAGVSGILGALVPARRGEAGWRLAFLAGLPLGAWLGVQILGAALPAFAAAPTFAMGPAALLGAGVLVGIGTRLSGGCTSGHGVCGLARLSPRSLVAVGVFMAVAVVTVTLLRHAA